MGETKKDYIPFYIAVIIFVGFLFFISLYFKTIDLETVKIIITAFVAWIGAIIGFYFGQKPVGELTGQVRTLSNETAIAVASKDDDTADLAKALEKYKNLEIMAAQLSKKLEDLMKGVE